MGRGGLHAAELAMSSTSGLISRNGKVQHGAILRPPMSPMRFRAVLEMLGWTQPRLAAELRVSKKSVNNWVKGRQPVSRPVELAMLFLLIREKPAEMAANSAELERIP